MKRLREFIRWVRRLARRSRNGVWDEDPVNLQIPEEMLVCRCEPCTGCPDIAKCDGGGQFLEMLDDLQTGGK